MSVFIGFSGAPTGTSPGGSITISSGQIVGRSPTETGSGAASGKSLGNGLGWSGGQVVATTQMSVAADASGIRLVGDAATPGSSKYYGTDSGGNRGFWALPSGSGSTDLGVTTAAGQLTVTSSSGASAVIPAATALLAGVMTSTDKAKLDGIAAGATVNATNAALRDRSTHTGTQGAASISDLAANTRMQVQSMLIAGANVSLTVSGSGDSMQITVDAATGDGTDLDVITAAGQLTVTSSTGASAVLPAANGIVAGVMSAADKTKLDGIAAGATANSPDANLRSRSNHTGTQAASTISDLSAAVRAEVEAMLVSGANITLTASGTGSGRQVTVSSTGGGSMPSVIPIASGGTGATTAQAAVTNLTTSLARAGTTSNFTLQASDSGAIIETEATSPITITVPADLPVGFNVVIVQGNTGQITLASSGVTLKSLNNQLKTAGVGAAISIFPGRMSGNYIVSGATAA